MTTKSNDIGPLGITRDDLARLPITGLQMLIVALGTARGGTFTEREVLADVAAWQRQHGVPTREAVVEFLRNDFSIGFGLRLAARRYAVDSARGQAAERRKNPR